MTVKRKFRPKLKRTSWTVKEIYHDRRHNIKDIYSGNLARKILLLYFKYLKEYIIAGLEFKFPLNFGRIAIVKRNLGPGEKTKISKVLTIKAGKAVRSFNPNRVNIAYRVRYDAPEVAKMGYTLKIGAAFRKQLYEILTTTNKDYRSE